MRYMSFVDYSNRLSCCNPFYNYGNDFPAFSNPCFNSLVILFLFFGGGRSLGSFWGPYNQIYGCSGFNSDWCGNNGYTNQGANIPTVLNSAKYINNQFQS